MACEVRANVQQNILRRHDQCVGITNPRRNGAAPDVLDYSGIALGRFGQRPVNLEQDTHVAMNEFDTAFCVKHRIDGA